MPVVAPDGVVGHVIESWRGGAKVRVLTDPESAIAVRTDRRIRSPASRRASEGSDELVVDDFGAHAKVRRGRRRS